MAVMILGIGIISIASLFPAGIAQQRQTTDDVMGPVVANNAIAVIRAKVDSSDFGTMEEFCYDVSNNDPLFSVYDITAALAVSDPDSLAMTNMQGDWPWLRPGLITGDDDGDPSTPCAQCGSIDIFSSRFVRIENGTDPGWFNTSVVYLTEFPGAVVDVNAESMLYGIPFNRSKHDPSVPAPPFSGLGLCGVVEPTPPEFIITQQERMYPQQTGDPERQQKPQYVWDCMFRRYHGQMQVAVFVYRVNTGGNDSYRYVAQADPSNPGRPLLPRRLNLQVPLSPDVTVGAWDAYITRNPATGTPNDEPIENAARVPGTIGGTSYDVFDIDQSWQEPGQWLVDQNLKIHRVLNRSREMDSAPETVELVRPVAPLVRGPLLPPPTPGLVIHSGANFFATWSGPGTPAPLQEHGVVTDIWYIPTEIKADVDGDGDPTDAGSLDLSLTPVYAAVFDL